MEKTELIIILITIICYQYIILKPYDDAAITDLSVETIA